MIAGPPLSVFMRLLGAYRRHGYKVRAGLNPYYFGDPDAAFARLVGQDGRMLAVGSGIAPQELHFLELLVASGVRPARVLIIGNAFGWSALAMGMLLPDATIVAMEADLEGDATTIGTALTVRIAEEEGVNVRVVQALSPRDTPEVVSREFGGQPIDLVFVDGLHVNEQLVRDVDGVRRFCGPDCLFLLHDVLSWHMLQAFDALDFLPGHERRVLTRTPSGIGIAFPANIKDDARGVIDMHSDETVDLPELFTQLGATPAWPGQRLEARLAHGWKHRRFGMAHTHAREGRSDLERGELAQLVAERPFDPVARYELGAWDAHHSDWSRALESLRIAETLSPKWALPAQQLGRVLRELGRLSDARARLARAAALNADWAAPHFELGLVASAEGDDKRAAAHFARAVELEPEWDAARRELGLASFRSGELGTARRQLETFLAKHRDDALASHVLALTVEGLDGLASAATWFEEAAQRHPASPEAHFDLARARVAKGDFAGAVAAYRETVEKRPKWPEAHYDLGCALLRLNDNAGAVRHFKQATSLRPEWTDARLAGGRAAFVAQQYPLVIEMLAPLVDTSELSAELTHFLALAAEHVGQIDDSVRWYEQAAALNPESADVQFDLARVRAATGDDRSALRHYARAIRLRPSWVDARIACGETAYRLGVAARAWASHEGQHSTSSGAAGDSAMFSSGPLDDDGPDVGDDAADATVRRARQCCEDGRVCAVRGDFANALRHFSSASELQPAWIEPWVAAFESATVVDDRTQIVHALTALTSMLPRSTPLWYELALVSAQLGQSGEAEEACRRAIDIELWTEPVKIVAESLLAHGQAGRALSVVNAALSKAPEWPGALFVRGRSLEQLGDLTAAHASFAQAHALRPAWSDAAAAVARTSSLRDVAPAETTAAR